MIKKIRTDEKGFTLIELMIVIAIIGILSAIAIPNFVKYRRDSANGSARSEAKSFYNAAGAHAAVATEDSITFTGANSPEGFSPNTNEFVYDGSIVFTASNGTLTSSLTVKHRNGDATYTVENNGAVH